MENILIEEQTIARTFYLELCNLYKQTQENSLDLIPLNNIIIIEEDNNSTICRALEKNFTHNHVSTEIFSLLKKLIKEDTSINFFQTCQKIFSLVEIFCEDTDDNIVISSEALPLSDLKLLSMPENFKASIDLTQNSYAPTNMNIYYRDSELLKFKFKKRNTSFISEANKMIIDDIIIESDENFINDFVHNIRAFLGCLICQVYYLIDKIKIICGRYIIDGLKEPYYGQLQAMMCPDIIDLMRYVKISTIIFTCEKMHVSFYLNKRTLNSDMEIFTWTNFMGNCQVMIEKLEASDVIKIEIEKFLLLIALSYNNLLLCDDVLYLNLKQEEKQNVIGLIDECMDIIKSEIEFQKKISDWSLFNLYNIFHLNHSVEYFILREFQTKMLKIIIDKTSTLVSTIKIGEFNNIINKRVVKENEISNFKKVIEKDVKKLMNCIKFLFHANWTADLSHAVTEQINMLINTKNKLMSCQQVLGVLN